MEGRRTWDGVPLGESHSPPQSVPGRRTPLGAVGLGGFYMQGGQPPPPPQHCYPTDENQPEPGTSYAQRLVVQSKGTLRKTYVFLKQKHHIFANTTFDICLIPAPEIVFNI